MVESGKQLKRGTLELILLRLLEERPKYGYELVAEMGSRSDGAFLVKEGTLYPVLYRLEDHGLIEPEWTQPLRGVPRKYYRLTAAGTTRLRELLAEWHAFTGAVQRLLEAPGPTTEEDV